MMELVDMQGLKPCPSRGPGSSPGVGIIYVHFKCIKYMELFVFFYINLCDPLYVTDNLSTSYIRFLI